MVAVSAPAAPALAYPAHLAHRRTLPDGREVTVRPIHPDDASAEREFFDRLCGESKRMRFMEFVKALNEPLIHFFTHIDYQRHMAFVCEARVDGAPRLVGEARYIANPDGRSCELGVVIADDWHHSGIARCLMDALIGYARSRGYATMEGFVLADNLPMLRFVKPLGFRVQPVPQDSSLVRIVRTL